MTIIYAGMMSPSIIKTKIKYVCAQRKHQGISCTQGLKICRVHNMKKKTKRDLTSYLKTFREARSFLILVAIIWGVWSTHQMIS